MKKPMTRSCSFLSLLLGLCLAVACMAASCEKPENICTCETPEPVDSVSKLQGILWKLEGVVNVQTGEMQVLEPVDYGECYTLVFATDTTGIGHSSTNRFWFNLKQPPYVLITTLINEIGDGELFSHFFAYSTHYELDSKNAKLKFFCQYENSQYYLLYKKLP